MDRALDLTVPGLGPSGITLCGFNKQSPKMAVSCLSDTITSL
ncbi:MAG: hypothetical protein PHC56_11845 [Herbinix sp.]|nr:hypothetical protein [Herbinix sp.]